MKRIPLFQAIKRITILWLCFTIFILILLLIQNFFEKYGTESNSSWRWFLVHFLPANLILFMSHLRYKNLTLPVLAHSSLILYRIALWISISYLSVVTAIFLIQPFSNAHSSEAQKLHNTDVGLYIFQGLFLLVIAFLIFRIEREIVLLAPEQQNSQEEDIKVFISYNHADKITAHRLKDMLQHENIDVAIDSEAISAGEDIKTFIEKSIFSSQIVISIISNKSLLSV